MATQEKARTTNLSMASAANDVINYRFAADPYQTPVHLREQSKISREIKFKAQSYKTHGKDWE